MIYIFLHILSYDIWFYFTHRFMHKYFYNQVHKKHHSVFYKNLKYSDAYNSEYSEDIIKSFGVMIPFIFIKLNIIQFFVALIFINLRGILRHNYSSSFLIGTHHLLHHKYPEFNYGEYWIDFMFGTLLPNKYKLE
jgi:sterol desaturase/sphingolipid hydroxylase (fatty acid hydroxylase superfamily)